VFNSRLVLASPATATDGDYSAIEGVVGHEYFHNWTGNRVTCRDWYYRYPHPRHNPIHRQSGCAMPCDGHTHAVPISYGAHRMTHVLRD
jgi:hypothetical protein